MCTSRNNKINITPSQVRGGVNSSSGFIALISAIIIAALLVGLCFTASETEFTARGAVLHSELSKVSHVLADSCIDSALFSISQNYSYTIALSGEPVTVGSNTCTILSITYSDEDTVLHQKTATIQTSASVRGIPDTEQVIATIHNPSFVKSSPDQQDINIVSWTELP